MFWFFCLSRIYGSNITSYGSHFKRSTNEMSIQLVLIWIRMDPWKKKHLLKSLFILFVYTCEPEFIESKESKPRENVLYPVMWLPIEPRGHTECCVLPFLRKPAYTHTRSFKAAQHHNRITNSTIDTHKFGMYFFLCWSRFGTSVHHFSSNEKHDGEKATVERFDYGPFSWRLGNICTRCLWMIRC